jgi:hypothetical protein
MITSREIRELLARKPEHLFYIISSILDVGLSESLTKKTTWVRFEAATNEGKRWHWVSCHADYEQFFSSTNFSHRQHFSHPDPLAYTQRLIKYAFKLGYIAEASLCVAALREIQLWEPPVENHVPVRDRPDPEVL